MHDLVNGSMHFFKVVKRRERVLPMCTYFFASFFQKDQQVSIHLRTDEKWKTAFVIIQSMYCYKIGSCFVMI